MVYCYFVLVFAASLISEPDIFTALYLADQTIIFLFLLFRRTAQRISDRPLDYAVAAAGTLLPLLAVPSSGGSILPIAFCAILFLAGMMLHILAKLSLRRSFGIVAADRGIKAEGAYRFVRHPMYLGYMMVHAALLLAGPSLWNAVVFGLTWLSFILRITAEERVLGQNEAYRSF
jgi:protein-S-isoprenylcysteine O-methyltransferase Ste14